jgi:putative transposase
MLYVVVNGCKWRDLPDCLPPYKTVYHYFRQWSANAPIDRIHKHLILKTRRFNRRKAEPSLLIIDSQSVRTSNQYCSKGVDGNKKIKGRKRHTMVDVLGQIHEIHVSEANKHDRPEAKELISSIASAYPRVRKLIADRGYDERSWIGWVELERGWKVEISEKLTETVSKGFTVQPFRWVVERTFAWLNQSRRLVRDYEIKAEHSKSMIWLCMTRIMLNRLRYS